MQMKFDPVVNASFVVVLRARRLVAVIVYGANADANKFVRTLNRLPKNIAGDFNIRCESRADNASNGCVTSCTPIFLRQLHDQAELLAVFKSDDASSIAAAGRLLIYGGWRFKERKFTSQSLSSFTLSLLILS